jgi:3-oxoisoapionate decarboxylase
MTSPEIGGRPRIGLDNYGLFPLDLTPAATLSWAAAHGADGVAFSGLSAAQQARLDRAALTDLRDQALAQDLYLEWGGATHIPRDMTSWTARDVLAVNRRAAQEAEWLGARIVRSCSGGLMRWNPANPDTSTLLAETARALTAQAPMLRDHGVVLAIETHFEFTSFELLRLFEQCDTGPGDWLGVCLDTMNLLTLLEEPCRATERLLPWVVSTHIKDGGILMDRTGMTTFPVPIGQGIIDLAAIVRLLGSLPREVTLSVEDHAGSFLLPVHDAAFLGRFPDLTGPEFAALVDLSEATAGVPACRPADRGTWPAVCEARLSHDLRALRELVRGAERGGTTAS